MGVKEAFEDCDINTQAHILAYCGLRDYEDMEILKAQCGQ